MLKQGLGRLIRTATDRGILAVLDSRLLTKSYGRRFLESLPPARLVHDLGEVARFIG
jgi:ATP-dependent DNA helicase DinG